MQTAADAQPHRASAPRRRVRKRPRVPEEQRQRAVVACSSCRRLKEKCDANVPCERCRRYGRPCEAVSPRPRFTASRTREDEPSERTKNLEFIARHFLGDIPLTDERLRRVVTQMQTDRTTSNSQARGRDEDSVALDDERFTVKPLSQSTSHYSGEFSHWNFSQRLKKQVDKRLQDVALSDQQEQFRVMEYWRANHLKSRNPRIGSVRETLPPRPVAALLSKTYFAFAQTNTFFVDEAWVEQRIDALYSTNATLGADDAAWLCTTLMVLAIGTQFVRMAETQHNPGENSSTESAADAVGVSFYQIAAEMIPDIIAIASVESVQAFLLLAHYALPLDTQGLAYTYLGLALKMAVQNGMHRNNNGDDLDVSTVDLRNRLWWTTYRLEKRISILHGRPTSIPSSEIDADYPSDFSPVPVADRRSRALENAMTKITDWLGDIAFVVHMLRRSPQHLRRAYFERLLQIRQQYVRWWRDADVPEPFVMQTRSIAHIYLSHHLNIVFLGRPFMLNEKMSTSVAGSSTNDSNPAVDFAQKRSELVRDAVTSAEQIIAVCKLLYTGIGLARASYVEFSSCRAAVLVLLAQSLNQSSPTVRGKLTEGMQLIRHMAPANVSTQSEASVMTAIEASINRLGSHNGSNTNNDLTRIRSNDVPLDVFEKWASKFHCSGHEENPEPSEAMVSSDSVGTSDLHHTFGEFGWSLFDASMLDGEPDNLAGLGTYHFEEAFSIANGGLSIVDVQSTNLESTGNLVLPP